MSTDVLDELEQRRALVRAQAAAIADASRPPHRFTATPGVRLERSARKRTHARRSPRVTSPRRRVPWLRRGIAVAALAVQVTLLVLALTLPAFQVRRVTVSGVRLLSVATVITAAAVPEQSIFTIDGQAVAARVLELPWVQSATVATDLPATVRISVVERAPALRVRRDGADTLVATNGATLPAQDASVAAAAGIPVLIDDRAGAVQQLAPALVPMLGQLAQRFPAVFHCSVAAYLWGADGVVSIWASTGWRAVLGHLDTATALAALPGQVATLAALRAQLDFANPGFGYVDVEATNAPVTGGKPGLPAEVVAAQAPADARSSATVPADSSVPTPTLPPSPTPSPGSTPATLTIPQSPGPGPR